MGYSDEMARRLALGLCGEKESNAARWYDLIWLTVPVVGIRIFVGQVVTRARVEAPWGE